LHALTAAKAPGLMPFTGDSANCADIFAVLQRLIDERDSTQLNGDWPFVCAMLGLKGSSATHPCFICTVGKQNLLANARLRRLSDYDPGPHKFSPADQERLVIIPFERIVPEPLHVLLGTANNIVTALGKLLTPQAVQAALAERRIKTEHTAGCGGESDRLQLNGPEVGKWIAQNCTAAVVAHAPPENVTAPGVAQRVATMDSWMRLLYDTLLHGRQWERGEATRWKAAVAEIQSNWQAVTGAPPTPKVHMLRHSAEFALRFSFLGLASESQLESYHSSFKRLLNLHHFNTKSSDSERQRRCLADSTLVSVQGVLIAPS
jgi:hypothetical protein